MESNREQPAWTVKDETCPTPELIQALKACVAEGKEGDGERSIKALEMDLENKRAR